MKYVGTYSDPKDIVTKDKLEAVASRVSTNEDNIAMAESDIEGLQTTVGTLQTNVNNVQTALTSKQDTVVGGASTITKDNLTANRALVSNSYGKVTASTITSTELGYLDGVTSNVQTQLDKKLETAPVASVNGATGEVKTNWYFDVTGSVASPATTQTVAQIVAAQAAGFAPICKAVLSEFNEFPATLPALLISEMMCVFGGIGVINGIPSYLSVMINAFGALEVTTDNVATKADIPARLANPYSLNIKIGGTTTIYDGSAQKIIEIPKGVPSVTTADNGKFLRVVNGVWAAAAIDNANGGSF